MNVLVIGSGGREAAAVKALAEQGGVGKLFVAPGNPGMRDWATLAKIEANNIDGLLKFAISNNVDLTFVGPEAPLIAGIVDEFHGAGLKIVGPNQKAARFTEGSKSMTQTLQMYGVQIARGVSFVNPEKACQFIDGYNEMLVVKADELAAGKGVIVGRDKDHAKDAVRALMVDKVLGPNIGNKIVIQQKLVGDEISFHVLVGKDGYKILWGVRDYKRAPDGNNTGGLGAKTIDVPAWVVDAFIRLILEPTLKAFKQLGIVYEGILYAGCMLVGTELFLLEYNCRFGDPEMQVMLAKLKTHLLGVLLAIAYERVSRLSLEYHDGEVVLVVGCSPGYPGLIPDEAKNKPIQAGGVTCKTIPVGHDGIYVLPAGVSEIDGKLVNSSGRALNFVARRHTHTRASGLAYALADTVGFDGMWYLPGIGTSI